MESNIQVSCVNVAQCTAALSVQTSLFTHISQWTLDAHKRLSKQLVLNSLDHFLERLDFC